MDGGTSTTLSAFTRSGRCDVTADVHTVVEAAQQTPRGLRNHAGDPPPDRLAARWCRDGDPGQQERRQLLRCRPWHGAAATVHHQCRRSTRGGRRHGARRVRDLRRRGGGAPLRDRHEPDRARRSRWRLGDDSGPGSRLPAELPELGHHPRVQDRRHPGPRDRRVRRLAPQDRGQRGRGRGSTRGRCHRPGHLAVVHDRLDRGAQPHARQLRRGHLHRHGSDRELRRQEHDSRTTPGATPAPRPASTYAARRTR